MPTFNLTAPSPDAVVRYRETLNKIKDERKDVTTQAQALELLFDIYEEGISKLESQREPASVERTLQEIVCPYLHYEDYEFKCFEQKKILILGTDPNRIKIRCETCKTRKAEGILQQYQKKLRGQNIKGLLQMIKQFQAFAELGIPSTIHFCNRIPGTQVMTGKNDILCSKHDNRVPIDPTCTDPKCPHYENYMIMVEQEFPKHALELIEGIAEDFKQIEELTPTTKKDVESEQVKKE